MSVDASVLLYRFIVNSMVVSSLPSGGATVQDARLFFYPEGHRAVAQGL